MSSTPRMTSFRELADQKSYPPTPVGTSPIDNLNNARITVTLPVHYFCSYYPQSAIAEGGIATQEQWDAIKFTKAVKYRTINGWLHYRGERIDQSRIGRPREIFGSFISSILTKNGLGDLPLVPAPSKDGLVGAATFRTLDMLEECRSGRQWKIEPILRMTSEITPASKGGPRGRYVLQPHIKMVAPASSSPVVLVDDLCTSGGTVLACFDILKSNGVEVAAAIVCSFTNRDKNIQPFLQSTTDLQTSSLFDNIEF